MVAVFVLDSRLRCGFINNVAEFLTGLASAQAAGRLIGELLLFERGVTFEQSVVGRALSEGGAHEGQERLAGHDGLERPFSFRIAPLGEALGNGSVLELLDLSGETGTSRALRESEQRLRLAVEATHIGIWDVDATRGTRRWSPQFSAILGLPVAFEGDEGVFVSLIHPDDRERVMEDYRRAYEPGSDGTYSAEFRIRRADTGEVRWVLTTGRITFGADGEALRGIGTLRDIDRRRKDEEALRISEERQRLAVEANDVGTWDFDMITGEHRWSAQFKKLWGLPPEAPADTGLLHPLVDETDWTMIRDRWKAACDPAGDDRISLEYQIRRADDGAHRWVMFNGRIFFDDVHRRPARAVGIMLDTTERREAEERQRLILKEMNHRVKNNLAVVQAIVSQTMRMSPKPAEAFERIQARLMAIARTHDFLNMSDWGGVSLERLLQGELAPHASLDRERIVLDGQTIVLDSTSALSLGLVFHELATNAAKYGALSAETGRLRVTWELAAADDGEQTVTIEWVESRGPLVRQPRRRGFGSRLIEGSVKGRLAGAVDMEFAREGLHCRMSFPLPRETNAPES